jgi:Antitoxin MazE-like
MSKGDTAERVQRSRDRMRAKGMRLVQIWVPDTRAPGFAEEAARQCRLLAEWEATPEGRAEIEFWDQLQAETLADLPD